MDGLGKQFNATKRFRRCPVARPGKHDPPTISVRNAFHDGELTSLGPQH